MSTPTYWPTCAISARSSSTLSRLRSISACQPRPALARHPVQPGRVQLVALIFVDEFVAVDAGGIGQLHHAGVDRHDLAVDAVKLVDQRLDPVVVQVQFVHQHARFRRAASDRRASSVAEKRCVVVQRRGHPQRPASRPAWHSRGRCRSSVSSTCGFSAASIAASDMFDGFVVLVVVHRRAGSGCRRRPVPARRRRRGAARLSPTSTLVQRRRRPARPRRRATRPKVVSRSITSRSRMSSVRSSSRQMVMA